MCTNKVYLLTATPAHSNIQGTVDRTILHTLDKLKETTINIHICALHDWYRLFVCLSVCLSLSAIISLEPLDRSARNFARWSPVAVARSSSGGVALRYVLPVSWVTSRLAVVGRMSVHGLGVAKYSDHPTPSQLVADMDDNPFANILNNPHHVLHKCLPNKTDHSYNLRSRRHSLSLTVKTDCNNFLNRLLFKDIY